MSVCCVSKWSAQPNESVISSYLWCPSCCIAESKRYVGGDHLPNILLSLHRNVMQNHCVDWQESMTIGNRCASREGGANHATGSAFAWSRLHACVVTSAGDPSRPVEFVISLIVVSKSLHGREQKRLVGGRTTRTTLRCNIACHAL